MKKIITNIKRTWIMILSIISLFACQEFSIDSQGNFPNNIKIDAQSKYEIVATSPKSIIFNISSNVPWEIESDQSWCIPSPAMSSASSLVAEVSIQCEDNIKEEERIANITITAEGIENSTTIQIIQGAKGVLEVQPIDNDFPVSGGTATFTVTSNNDWKITSNRQWITFDKSQGTGTGEIETIIATCADNVGGAIRSAIITVSNGLEIKTFEVHQNGSFLQFKEIEKEDLNFDGEGESKIYEIESNIEWNVQSSNPDIIAEKIDNKKIKVSMGFNKIFTERKAKITLIPAGENISGIINNTIEISQAINFNLTNGVKGNSKLTIDPETGSATLESSTSEQCRVITLKNNFQLGKYTWTFSNVEVKENFWIDANFYAKDTYWHMYLGSPIAENPSSYPSNTFKTWAKGVNGFHNGVFEFKIKPNVNDVNTMKTLILEMKPKDGDDSKIITKLTLDDKILVNEEQSNPFKSVYPNSGTQIYFGFNGNASGVSHSPGKLTLTSFDVVRY